MSHVAMQSSFKTERLWVCLCYVLVYLPHKSAKLDTLYRKHTHRKITSPKSWPTCRWLPGQGWCHTCRHWGRSLSAAHRYFGRVGRLHWNSRHYRHTRPRPTTCWLYTLHTRCKPGTYRGRPDHLENKETEELTWITGQNYTKGSCFSLFISFLVSFSLSPRFKFHGKIIFFPQWKFGKLLIVSYAVGSAE